MLLRDAFELAVVLGLIPFVQVMIGLYFYSCLPLHMSKQGMPLINIGIIQSSCLAVRLAMPLVALKHGVGLENLILPCITLPLASGILSCYFPANETLVYVNLFCLVLLPGRSMAQAAAVKLMPSDQIKALRVFEASYTLGYCLSSLWGAGLYSTGGWELCMQGQVAVLATTLVSAGAVRILQPRNCGHAESSDTGEDGKRGEGGGPGESNSAVAMMQLPHGKEGSVGVGGSSGLTDVHSTLPPAVRRLCYFLCCGSFACMFAYNAEWCIFLLYFTSKFEIGTLAIGTVLALSVPAAKRILVCVRYWADGRRCWRGINSTGFRVDQQATCVYPNCRPVRAREKPIAASRFCREQ